MHNRRTLTLIHGAAEDAKYNSQYYQSHKDWKKAYNAKYYQEHKDYWRDYYGTKNRQSRTQQVDLDQVDFGGIINQFTQGKYAQGASAYKLATEISDGVVNGIVPVLESNMRETGGGRTSKADMENAIDVCTDYAYDAMKRQLGDSIVGSAINKKLLRKMFSNKIQKMYNSLMDDGVVYTRPMERTKNVTGTSSIIVRKPKTNVTATTPSSITAGYEQRKAERAAAEARAKSAHRSAMVEPKRIVNDSRSTKTSSGLFSKLADAGKSFASAWKLGWK